MQRKEFTETIFYLFWLSTIFLVILYSENSVFSLSAIIFLMLVLLAFIHQRIKENLSLKEICSFYKELYAFDDMELLGTDDSNKFLLDETNKLGYYDWSVLFLIDYEKNVFYAAEASGINISLFKSFDFSELEHTAPDKLSYELLKYVFKKNEVRGALASTNIEKSGVYYGSLLVGRRDPEAILTPDDVFRLELITDRISIALNNCRLHKELSIRAAELSARQNIIQGELEIAKTIQDSVMRRAVPVVKGLEIKTFFRPARFIGGDFVKFLPDSFEESDFACNQASNSDDKLCLLTGDVCGKGIPAAMVLSVVYSLFKARMKIDSDPANVMKDVNGILKELLGAGSHFNSTAMLGRFDMKNRIFTYASAGHEFPLLWHKDGTFEELSSTGTVLGFFYESEFYNKTIPFKQGDRFFFFSDGLSDFLEEFTGNKDTISPVKDYLEEHKGQSLEQIVSGIVSKVDKTPAAIKDDITLSAIEIL